MAEPIPNEIFNRPPSDKDVEHYASQFLSDTELAHRYGWRHNVACEGTPVHTWFPVRRASIGYSDEDLASIETLENLPPELRPKAKCYECTVRFECMSEAIHDDHQGIWGGTSHIFRKKVLEYLTKHTKDKVSPECGTVNAWLRHKRDNDRTNPPCSLCVNAANDAGYLTQNEQVRPLSIAFSKSSQEFNRDIGKSEAKPRDSSLR